MNKTQKEAEQKMTKYGKQALILIKIGKEVGIIQEQERIKKIIDECDVEPCCHGINKKELKSKLQSPQIDVEGKPMIPPTQNTSGKVTSVTEDTFSKLKVYQVKDKFGTVRDCVLIEDLKQLQEKK